MTDVSKRSQAIRPFVVMDLVARAKELEASGRDIVRLEIGDPDFPTPAVITRAAEVAMQDGSTHYTQSLGLPGLRNALTARYRRALWRGGRSREHSGDPRHLAGDAAALRFPARSGRRSHHARPVLPGVPELRRLPRRRPEARSRSGRGRLPVPPGGGPGSDRAPHEGHHDQLPRQPHRRRARGGRSPCSRRDRRGHRRLHRQ